MRDLRIPLPPDFDFAWARDFLAARAAPSLETVPPDGYERTVRLDGKAGRLALRHDPEAGVFEVRASSGLPKEPVRQLVTRMFGLDHDLAAFHARVKKDPLLGPIVAVRPGIRLQQFPELFEGVVRAIVGQQVSVAGARTVVDRLARALAEPVSAPEGPLLLFPTPESFVEAGPERLTTVGLTRAKAAALTGAAQAILDGRLDADRLRASPAEEADAALQSLPGLGPWTASYIRMRALGDLDAFPASDLGVLKALRALFPDRDVSARDALALAEDWRPWRAYATIHLWRSLDPS